MAREAMIDLLKFAFNILTHYPKVHLLPALFSASLIYLSSLIARKLSRLAAVMTAIKSWASIGLIDSTGLYDIFLSAPLLTGLFLAFFPLFFVPSTHFHLAHRPLSHHLSITSFMHSSRFLSRRIYKQYGCPRTLVAAVVPHPPLLPLQFLQPVAALPLTPRATLLAPLVPLTVPNLCSPPAAGLSPGLPPLHARFPHRIRTPSYTRMASSKSHSRITSQAQSSPTTPRCAQLPRPRARAR